MNTFDSKYKKYKEYEEYKEITKSKSYKESIISLICKVNIKVTVVVH